MTCVYCGEAISVPGTPQRLMELMELHWQLRHPELLADLRADFHRPTGA